MHVSIDVERLRGYLLDHCGTAAIGGFPAAWLDVIDLESASPEDLLKAAERLGIDPRRFAIGNE